MRLDGCKASDDTRILRDFNGTSFGFEEKLKVFLLLKNGWLFDSGVTLTMAYEF